MEMMWSAAKILPTPSSFCSSCLFPTVLQTHPSKLLHLPSHPSLPRCSTFTHSPGPNSCVAATKLRASLEDSANDTSSTILQQDLPSKEVEDSIKLLKDAAKTRKIQKNEVLSALSIIEKAKLDPSGFLETLGGLKSPGRTWMLIFTAEKQYKGGRYFPITAVQRFDAEAKRIENGVYLGFLGNLKFEGPFSWKKRILAFIFERIRIKVGPFSPLEFNLGNEDGREPSTKDPFFIWFYVDEEIAVARGRSGGTAFWCRCRQVASP